MRKKVLARGVSGTSTMNKWLASSGPPSHPPFTGSRVYPPLSAFSSRMTVLRRSGWNGVPSLSVVGTVISYRRYLRLGVRLLRGGLRRTAPDLFKRHTFPTKNLELLRRSHPKHAP